MTPLIVMAGLVAAAPVPAGTGNAEMDALWADLAKDEPFASRALLKLAAKKEATAYLKGKLVPLKIEADRVKKLIADLDSDDEKVWKPAFEEFEYLDPRLGMSLPDAFDASTGVGRQRLVAVMGDQKADAYAGKTVTLSRISEDWFNFRADNGSWGAEPRVERVGLRNGKKYWTRATRAISLLEHLGTPAATEVLRNLASGHPDAAPTKAAKAALERTK